MSDAKVEEIYNKKAGFYDKLLDFCQYQKSLQKFLRSLDISLPVGAKILDVGCGNGIVTEVLADKYPHAQICGLDLSTSMLEICQKKVPDAFLVQGNFNLGEGFVKYPSNRAFGFVAGSFDMIISSGALSEHGDVEKSLPFVKNLLKPNGLFLNIGIGRSPIMHVLLKYWEAEAQGRRRFQQACFDAGFKKVETHKIPFKFAPTSLSKYMLTARA